MKNIQNLVECDRTVTRKEKLKMEHHILTSKTLGEIVQKARKVQNLTQEDLAGMSRTGRRFIGDLESGKETAQIGKVIKVLGVLGIALITSSKWE